MSKLFFRKSGAAALLRRVGPVGDVAPVHVDLGVREVPPAAGDEAAHVVLVHVGDDDGADAVRPDADRLQGSRQPPRLAEGARGSRVDQDQALAVVDEVLVEHEPDAAGLGRERRARGLLDLLRRAAGEVGERHVRVAVDKGRDREAADGDPRQRRDRPRADRLRQGGPPRAERTEAAATDAVGGSA
jgi:hypothetical protein